MFGDEGGGLDITVAGEGTDGEMITGIPDIGQVPESDRCRRSPTDTPVATSSSGAASDRRP